MKDALILEHKTYISAKRAAQITGYTSDYIGQLCRAGKLDCKMVGRSWFVIEQSILNYSYVNSDLVKVSKKTESENSSFSNTSEQEVAAISGLLTERVASVLSETVLETTKQEESIPAKKSLNVSPVIPPANETLPIRFVPSQFSMQKFSLARTMSQEDGVSAKISSYKFQSVGGAGVVHAHPEEKMVLAILVLAFGLSGFFLETSLGVFNSHSGKGQTASAVTISKEITLSAVHSFQTAVAFVGQVLGLTSKTNFLAQSGSSYSSQTKNQSVNSSSGASLPTETNFNKIAVVPSTGTISGDEKIKQKIRDSFSDEVAIHPDATGSSGVIVPVFKKATTESFVYVLVPLQGNPKQ